MQDIKELCEILCNALGEGYSYTISSLRHRALTSAWLKTVPSGDSCIGLIERAAGFRIELIGYKLYLCNRGQGVTVDLSNPSCDLEVIIKIIEYCLSSFGRCDKCPARSEDIRKISRGQI